MNSIPIKQVIILTCGIVVIVNNVYADRKLQFYDQLHKYYWIINATEPIKI